MKFAAAAFCLALVVAGCGSTKTVTVRDRDSLAQERLPLGGVRAWLDDALEREWRTPKGD